MNNIVGIINSNIEECSDKKIKELLEIINYKPKKDKIFLKPNLVTDEPGESGVTTHPKVIEAICDYFLNLGYDHIVIGEGSAFFYRPHHWEYILKSCNYDYLRKRPEIEILNLEEKNVQRENYHWKYGKLKLPKIIKTHEYINIPTMKTHYQTQVSLGCKNQKGLLLLKDKRMFHKKNLNDYILELNKILKPDLTIMDAIYCIEGNGPAKNPMSYSLEMNLLLASTNIIALDNVCCEIMGFDIEKIPYIPKVKFQSKGVAIEKVKKSFKQPTWITYFDNIGRYMSEKACSGCQIAHSQMMRKINFTEELNKKLDKLKNSYQYIYLVYGENPDLSELSLADEIKIMCLGNCAKKFAKKHNFPWISGCPPDYHEMIKFLLEEEMLE